MMAPRKLETLKYFFTRVEPRLAAIVDLLYTKLFACAPEVATLFQGDLEAQKARFTHMLKSLVRLTSHLWPVSALDGQATLPGLSDLKKRHARAGVTAEHFHLMKVLLMEACRELEPEEFTPDVAEALAFVFDVLARSLTATEQAPLAILPGKDLPQDGAAPADFAGYLGVSDDHALA